MTVQDEEQVRVWDLFVRVFHWTIVVCVFGAFFIISPRDLHKTLGWIVAGALVLRFVWGWIGSRHARFTDFVPGPRTFFGYARDLFRGRERRYLGHNPAGGAMVVALMSVLVVVATTGWMMGTDAYFGEEWVEELHHLLANGLMAMIALHVAGVVWESVRHGENLVLAMISGRKKAITVSLGGRHIDVSDGQATAALKPAESHDAVEAVYRLASAWRYLHRTFPSDSRVIAARKADPVIIEDVRTGRAVTKQMLLARLEILDTVLKLLGSSGLTPAMRERVELRLRNTFSGLSQSAQAEWASSEVRLAETKAYLASQSVREMNALKAMLAGIFKTRDLWDAARAFSVAAHLSCGRRDGRADIADLLELRKTGEQFTRPTNTRPREIAAIGS